MTREQARVYTKLSREDLKKIDEGYAKHYDIICSFADGAEIESRYCEGDDWVSNNDDPDFYDELGLEYRVKPSTAKPTELWKPKDNERFLYIGLDGEVMDTRFDGTVFHHNIVDFGNCFKSYEEADEARERVCTALKGETLPKTEAVKPLCSKSITEQHADPWKPKNSEYYFFLSYDGEVIESHWNGSRCDIRSFEMGNCFRTRAEAEAARKRVRAALRCETLCKTEVIESLDDNPLEDYEKELLRVFRKAKMHEYCMIEKVVKFESLNERGIKLLIPYSNGRVEFFNAISKFTKEIEK